jgi:hypothetical protein
LAAIRSEMVADASLIERSPPRFDPLLRPLNIGEVLANIRRTFHSLRSVVGRAKLLAQKMTFGRMAKPWVMFHLEMGEWVTPKA